MLIEQQSQVLSVGGANIKKQSGTLAGPEAQGDVFCSQGHVREDGGRKGASAPVRLIPRLLLESVADGGSRLEAD